MLVLACVLMLFASSLTGLAGCKYSDVLTQHIEDPENGVLDEDAEPIYQSNPNAEERPDLADISVSDSDDENAQVQVLPHYDPTAPDNGPTKQRIKSPDTPHDEEASQSDDPMPDPNQSATGGESVDGGQGAGTPPEDEEPEPQPEPEPQGGEEPEPDTPPDGLNDVGQNEGTGEELVSDEVQDATQSAEGGGGGEAVVVNPDGTNDEVAKGSVAAVGEYATIAQMLGGAGALAACDQAWLDARAADGAFAGELDRVQVAFADDGTAEGSCDVDALVNSIRPSVVLWNSANNVPALSESDRARLQEAGITVQPVPHIGEQTTEDAEVTAAVSEVAAVLEGAAGIALSPVEVYSQYLSYHDAVLTDCYNANDGYSYKVCDNAYIGLYQNAPLAGLASSTTSRCATVYVDGVMQPSVSHAVVAQTASLANDQVLSLFHDGQELDVSDGIGLSASTNVSRYMLIDYYLQLAGVMNNAYDTAQPDPQGRPYIIMPGSTASFGASSMFAARSTASALFYNAGDGTVLSNWHALGNGDFPAVLASSEEVATMFVNSANKPDGLYRMESSYRVIIVPSGIAGIWSEGHLDSFLLAPWAFRIADEANLERVQGYAKTFYETFLRCGDWESPISNWNSVFVTAAG